MNLWITRDESLNALKSKLSIEARYIEKGFTIIDALLRIFEDNKNDNFCMVCSFALLKGKNFCFSIYSLSLDGLAQEAGALLRPAIECFELLDYFFADPKRIQEALENKLLSAGNIAKKINSKHKKIREHLNSTASHFSLNPMACTHLINWKKGSIRYYQEYNENVLRKNLWILFSIMVFLIDSAVRCLTFNELIDGRLTKEIEEWKTSGLKLAKEKML
ncbi:MAG: hypothetical protein DRP89_07885 [Candidatus Neomarinimicrobiota bacterium]|nr:MAG: hypothetical protein DRP89_07885 [Candidatus Neomarinimicrobiota bacterium]